MSEIENILGYKFKNKKLLEEALTHPSCSGHKNKKFNYERLEFLGDSILSFVVIEYLFKNHPSETEGELSKRKSFLVSKNTLYTIARSLKLENFMILSSGEENMGGRENISNLENIMEALIGAIYMDSNIENVRNFIISLIKKFDEKSITPPEPPKTELQNWTQKHFKNLPKYTIRDIGDSRNPCFLIKLEINNYEPIEMSGKQIKKVEEELAKKMLEIIKKNENKHTEKTLA